MKLQMQNGYLAVKSLPKEKTKSGIYLPSEADSDAQTSECEVVFVSKGSDYHVGDRVLFSKLVPDDVFLEDEGGEKVELWFVKESDIKAVVQYE